MAHSLKKMQAQHHAIVDRAVAGKTRKEIAHEFNRTPQSIGNTLSSPIVQAEIARRRGDLETQIERAETERAIGAREILDKAAGVAASIQVSHLHSSNERISQMAAMDILDRTGFPKVSKSETKETSLRVSLSENAFERMNAASLARFGQPLVSESAEELDKPDEKSAQLQDVTLTRLASQKEDKQ